MKRWMMFVLAVSLIMISLTGQGENAVPAGVAETEERAEILPDSAEAEGEAVPLADEEDGEAQEESLPEESDLEEEVLEGRTLQYGDEGDEVLALQTRLKELQYYTGNLSGRYREGTRAAVKSFQEDYGLEETGMADPETQGLIYSARYRPLRFGSSGEEVRKLQTRLTELGYYTGKVTGSYKENTQKSIRAFQEAMGLSPTGAADVRTLEAIYGSAAAAKQTEEEDADLSGFLVGDGENGSDLPTSVAFTKKLKSGSRGQEVKQLQARMTSLGYYGGPISGNFAKQTLRAVKAIQSQNGMAATGQVDEATWNVIFNDPGIVMPDATPKPTPEPTPPPYAMTVDVTNQVTTVYALDENGQHTVPVRRMLCSTGTKANPSDVGDWVLNGRHAKWCVFPKWGNSYARYWTRINSNIAFHSVIYTAVDLDAMKISSYKMLGNRASHGCIRLTVADAKWVYENIGAGTVVSIREDLPSDPELRDALKLPALKKGTSVPVETPVPTPEPAYEPEKIPQMTRKLKNGSEGPEVYWLQRRLQDLGFYTGYAGGKMLKGTENALKQFQKSIGVYASGVADQKTMEALAAVTPEPEMTEPAETPAPVEKESLVPGIMTPEPTLTPAP
ncbi:MAG: peptidoglycan-binding protein [Clostridia bacterium]|nr:peptidoglycan-binding protein [Clostridia bacterium]